MSVHVCVDSLAVMCNLWDPLQPHTRTQSHSNTHRVVTYCFHTCVTSPYNHRIVWSDSWWQSCSPSIFLSFFLSAHLKWRWVQRPGLSRLEPGVLDWKEALWVNLPSLWWSLSARMWACWVSVIFHFFQTSWKVLLCQTRISGESLSFTVFS